MEILTSFLAAGRAKTGQLVCGYFCSNIMKSTQLERKLNDLERKTKNLIDVRDEVKHELESSEKNGKSPKIEVKMWLREVEEFVNNVNSMQTITIADDKRFYGCLPLYGRQIRLGKEVPGLLIEVETLLKAGRFPTDLVYVNYSPKNFEHIPGPSVEGLKTASTAIAKFMGILEDGKFRSIGVWGMGGSWKDSSGEELKQQAQVQLAKKKPFSIVTRATASKVLDMKELQIQIAERLNLEVKLNILTDEEAWQLFSQKAGEEITLEYIKPYAASVARECFGLPLALIAVGTAMRAKTGVELWKLPLKELQTSAPCIRGVTDKVYNPLKWSTDSLESKNIKTCFLYCALYPKNFLIEIDELAQCWLAEGLMDEQKTSDESVTINRFAVIETLKDSCLLENRAHKDTVKMHDVVRDVALWLASSQVNECRFLVRSGIHLCKIMDVEFSTR